MISFVYNTFLTYIAITIMFITSVEYVDEKSK